MQGEARAVPGIGDRAAPRHADRLALRVELDVGELIIALRTDEALGEVRLYLLQAAEPFGIIDLDAVLVDLALVVGIGAIDGDERDGDHLLLGEALQQRYLLGM